MTCPRCIFTVTTGRSGTNFLTELLGRCQGVVSRHEPWPNYVHCMRHVQLHPELATEFLRDDKVPAITKDAAWKIYVETTHLFAKGFLEAWLSLSELPVPALVLLGRDYRKVSLSMLSLDVTPARTLRGAKWYLSPKDLTCYTQLPGWEELDDYQLCYWYCLETEARKALYADVVRRYGGQVVDVQLDELNTQAGFDRLRSELDIPDVGLKGRALAFLQRNRPVNTKSKKKRDVQIEATRLDEMEQQVRDRLIRNDAAHARLDELQAEWDRLRNVVTTS